MAYPPVSGHSRGAPVFLEATHRGAEARRKGCKRQTRPRRRAFWNDGRFDLGLRTRRAVYGRASGAPPPETVAGSDEPPHEAAPSPCGDVCRASRRLRQTCGQTRAQPCKTAAVGSASGADRWPPNPLVPCEEGARLGSMTNWRPSTDMLHQRRALAGYCPKYDQHIIAQSIGTDYCKTMQEPIVSQDGVGGTSRRAR